MPLSTPAVNPERGLIANASFKRPVLRRKGFEKLVLILTLIGIYVCGGSVSAIEVPPSCANPPSLNLCFTYVHDRGYMRMLTPDMAEWLEAEHARAPRSPARAVFDVFHALFRAWVTKTTPYKQGLKKMVILDRNGRQNTFIVRLDSSQRHQNRSAHKSIPIHK